MKNCCWSLLLVFAAATAAAQPLPPGFDETYAVTSLDPLLALQAEAVTRLHYVRFEVDSPGRARRTVRRTVTVLAPEGREAGVLYVAYDGRLRHLKKLRGTLRDADGRVLRKLSKDDQEDVSAISGGSLYEETRVRIARLYHSQYPYTVEFEYELHHDGLLNWPVWHPQEGGYPVQLARFEVEVPDGIEVRHTSINGAPEPTADARGRRTTLVWQVEQRPAFAREPYSPPWSWQAPAVHTAPVDFEIEGSRGRMDSWDAFARWYHALGEGRDALPPEAAAEVERLVAGIDDDREKARRLYAYLQQKTRYVSVQLGLGGWQPFDAAYVHERGYGDCKALTNYMRALLKAAGVPAFPALIRAGSRAPEVLDHFPSNQFDHVVLYVPVEGAPVWLECTSQTAPFGHLGSFTEDRHALVVRPGGGALVRTPRRSAEANQQARHAEVVLGAGGDAVATVRTRYTGNQRDRVGQALAQASARERTQWLRDHLGIPSFEIEHVDFSDLERRQPEVVLPMTLRLPRFAARTGQRLFLPLVLMEGWTDVPPAVEPRTQPVAYFAYPFADADTVRFVLPEGFRVEALPEPVALDAAFGAYRAEATLGADGVLVFRRRFAVTEATLPPEQYAAFRDFLARVAQADRARAVLVRE